MRNNFRGMFRNVNPAIVIIIIILIANRLLYSNQSPGEWLYSELLMLPGIIMGLTFTKPPMLLYQAVWEIRLRKCTADCR